ncbi:MAG: signal peptidase I [Gemmatimonadales bacterium]
MALSGDAAPRRWRWIPTTILLAILLGLGVLTRGFTALPVTYYMTGPSMEPAVEQGAWFLAGAPRATIERGALVLFEYWIDDTLYHVLRRAVGVPGDTLRMIAGRLAVNGAPAPWPARVLEPRADRVLDGPIPGTLYRWGPVIVGPDSVFLLSDTRDMLGWPDSRFLGAVPRARIVARYRFRICGLP